MPHCPQHHLVIGSARDYLWVLVLYRPRPATSRTFASRLNARSTANPSAFGPIGTLTMILVRRNARKESANTPHPISPKYKGSSRRVKGPLCPKHLTHEEAQFVADTVIGLASQTHQRTTSTKLR